MSDSHSEFRSKETIQAQVKSFLYECEASSQSAYKALKQLLTRLESPSLRKQALELWSELCEDFFENHTGSPQSFLEKYHFSISKIQFQLEASTPTTLLLLQLPSTFAPEQWSFAFFEGLTRYQPAEFRDRVVAELGCGIGWVSIALAMVAQPERIIGLDINPKAIMCSRFNLFVNGFNSNAEAIEVSPGKLLIDTVEFFESDLLEKCKDQRLLLDFVIGCIPQVLSPDNDFTEQVLKYQQSSHGASPRSSLEDSSDEILQSLSNYTVGQGYVEDQFGLGLLARALEESADVLKTSGRVLLNLGGRPGSAMLNHLFLRRGYSIRPIWKTFVHQAQDTDIRTLAEIEENTPHRFEFFAGDSRDIPIPAKTAMAYSSAGGQISHSIVVVEGKLRDPIQIPKLMRFLRDKTQTPFTQAPTLTDYKNARNALDLSFSDETLTLEKLSLLGELADYLQNHSYFPYENPAGLDGLRQSLSTFFSKFHSMPKANLQLPPTPKNEHHILILPSRSELCENLFITYQPERLLMDAQLARGIRKRPEIYETPRRSDVICELIGKLKPQIAIIALTPAESETRHPFESVLAAAKSVGCRIFFDISELIELSSMPRENGIFRELAKNPLPEHAALLAGLTKNRLYPELELCFLVSNNEDLHKSLESTAELTYSRTPLLSQIIIDRLLKDLVSLRHIHTSQEGSSEPSKKLNKQRGAKLDQTSQKNEAQNQMSIHEPPGSELQDSTQWIPLSQSAKQAFSHPCIAQEHLARAPRVIRLDYGENTLPSPPELHGHLFEAFSRKELSESEASCSLAILEKVRTEFDFDMGSIRPVTLGLGVSPLFQKIAEFALQNGEPLVFPSGSYGQFVASTTLLKGKHHPAILTIPTRKENHFKISIRDLQATLESLPRYRRFWLMLCAPLVNPSGALYENAHLEELIQVTEKHRGVTVLDTTFSGLEFTDTRNSTINLKKFSDQSWCLLGGISKQFSAAGLRLGHLVTPITELSEWFFRAPQQIPHKTTQYAVKKLYRSFTNQDPELMLHLQNQKKELRQRCHLLVTTLNDLGWTPIQPQGGLFLIAKPPKSQDPKTVSSELLKQTKIAINSPQWTGIEAHCRFVLSGPRHEFDEALARLHKLIK